MLDQYVFVILAINFFIFETYHIKIKLEQSKTDSLFTQTYAIIATNDIHGKAFPTQMIRSDTKQKYLYGGLTYMANMFQTIRNQYGIQNVLYLDGGDQYQGGIQASSLVSNGRIINQFLNAENVDATAIGNHQFDNGPDFLNNYLKSNISPFLAANLYSDKNQPVNQFIANSKKSQLFVLNHNIKIGVIGLITKDTPFTSSGFTKHLFPDYLFKQYADIIQFEAKNLRANGANAIILLAHQGNPCPGQSMTHKIWKESSQQISCPDGAITLLLDILPKGTINAVVQGHRHQIVHFYKNGIPVVGTNNGGFYFNILYLTFDKSQRKLIDTSIQGPIPVCQKIFSLQKRCNYIPADQISQAGQLVNWYFHGREVRSNQKIQTIYHEWIQKMKPFLQNLVQNQVYLQINKTAQSELGNLVSDFFLKASQGKADFSLVNPGSLRTTWIPGIIQYQHFYNMFPFENILQTFSIKGKQLKQVFSILQSGVKGFYISSNIKMTVTKSPKSLISITWANGTQINDQQQYIGITSDFLLSSGDDMATVINKGVYLPRNITNIGELRKILKQILIKQKVILPNTLIDPKNPRLIVV